MICESLQHIPSICNWTYLIKIHQSYLKYNKNIISWLVKLWKKIDLCAHNVKVWYSNDQHYWTVCFKEWDGILKPIKIQIYLNPVLTFEKRQRETVFLIEVL